jgi:hypothetical protein
MFVDGSCNVKIEGSYIKLVQLSILEHSIFLPKHSSDQVLSLQLQVVYVLMFFNCSISLLFLICNKP